MDSNLAFQTAKDVMTTPIITVPANMIAKDALRMLMEKHIKRLPVVDTNSHVVGLVGRAGLMRVILQKPPEDNPTTLLATEL